MQARNKWMRSLYLAGDDGLDEVAVVDLAVGDTCVLEDFAGLLFSEGLTEGVHDLLEIHFTDVAALLCIPPRLP
jgi:hypothetical protein